MGNSSKPDPQPPSSPKPAVGRPGPNLWVLLILIGVMAAAFFLTQGPRRSLIDYSFFISEIQSGNVEYVELGEQDATGVFNDPPKTPPKVDSDGKLVESQGDEKLEKHFRVVLPRDSQSRGRLTELLTDEGVLYKHRREGNALLLFYILALLLPLGLFAFFWFSYRRTRDQIMGGGFLSGFSKSPAKRYEAAEQPITFNDVAGLTGVKEDLMEIVEYLRCPEKFQRLGDGFPRAFC
jgi:cell division protease FtsH